MGRSSSTGSMVARDSRSCSISCWNSSSVTSTGGFPRSRPGSPRWRSREDIRRPPSRAAAGRLRPSARSPAAGHRANAQLAHRLVEPLRQQAVDHFLANLGGKAAPDHRLRHLAGAEPGIRAYSGSCGSRCGRPWRPLRREHPAPARGCIRIQHRTVAVLMRVVVGIVGVTFVDRSLPPVPASFRGYRRNSNFSPSGAPGVEKKTPHRNGVQAH